MTVFNSEHKTTQMFLGEELGVQEYINPRYPIFKKLADLQLDSRWRETEVPLNEDILQMNTLSPELQRIVNYNFGFQILADSIQGRGPAIFMLAASAPEVELCIGEWLSSEQLHSRTYTHVLRSLYPDPEVILRLIPQTKELLDRVKALIEYQDAFANAFFLYKAQGLKVDDYLREKLMDAMVATNILESIQFYVSFANTFGLAEMKLFEGVAKDLQFIMRDENMHVGITQNVINNWRNGVDGASWQNIWNKNVEKYRNMFRIAIASEQNFALFLYEGDSPIIGLNGKVMCSYIEFKGNKRMVNIGLEPLTSLDKDPLPWIQRNWVGDKQVAPQETQKTDYRTGNIRLTGKPLSRGSLK